METVVLPHLPQYPLHVCLFFGVKNAPFLRQQLLEGNSDFEYAFLDAAALMSRQHIFAACFRAITDMLSGRMKSKHVHSEIVFALSPNNNIAESFRRFGISDDSTNIVTIKVGNDATRVKTHLEQSVDGNMEALTDRRLSEINDPGRIQKVYRSDHSGVDSEAFAIGSMALRGS